MGALGIIPFYKNAKDYVGRNDFKAEIKKCTRWGKNKSPVAVCTNGLQKSTR